jgi:hypothetical protein
MEARSHHFFEQSKNLYLLGKEDFRLVNRNYLWFEGSAGRS